MLELVRHRLVQQFVQRQPPAEPIQFVLLRQSAEDQQPSSLDEVGVFGELFDGNAAIAKQALLLIDESNGTLADGRIGQRRVIGGQSGGIAKLGNIHGPIALSPHNDGKFNLLVTKTKDGFSGHNSIPMICLHNLMVLEIVAKSMGAVGCSVTSSVATDSIEKVTS